MEELYKAPGHFKAITEALDNYFPKKWPMSYLVSSFSSFFNSYNLSLIIYSLIIGFLYEIPYL